jgi:hypothetical protein
VVCGAEDETGAAAVVEVRGGAVEVTAKNVDGADVDVGAAVVASGEVVCGAEDETGAAAVVEVRGGAVEVTAADVEGADVDVGAAVVAGGEVVGNPVVNGVAVKMSTTSV